MSDLGVNESTVDMFEVDPTEIRRLFPSVVLGAAALDSLVRVERSDDNADPEDENVGSEPMTVLEDAKARGFSRHALRRERKNFLRLPLQRIAKTGSVFAASYSDPDEGLRAAKEILDSGSDGLFSDLDLGIEENIERQSRFLRRMRDVAQQTKTEIATARQSDIGESYTLLKVLAAGYEKKGKQNNRQKIEWAMNWGPGRALIALSALSGSDVQTQLGADLNAGAFDALIARDMLASAEAGRRGDQDLQRLYRLSRFMIAFGGTEPEDKPAFYDRLAGLIDTWPTAEHGVVIEARTSLRNSLDLNLNNVERHLKESGAVDDGQDVTQAYEKSIDSLLGELIKRETGPAKAQLLMLRTKRRTPRLLRVTDKAPKRAPALEPKREERHEPLKVVACNLEDNTQAEDTTSLVDAYLQRIGQQGSTVIREDIERMLHHMARTDLPNVRQRGTKTLERLKLRFGDDGELWDVHELKPSMAAGLSLRSNEAKNSRIYFIKLNDGSLGIFGVSPRADQEEFLRATCVKTKR